MHECVGPQCPCFRYKPQQGGGFTMDKSFKTGSSAIQGLAADFSTYPNTIFFTDSKDNSVSAIKVL